MKDLIKKPFYLLTILIVALILAIFFVVLPSISSIKENQTAVKKNLESLNDIDSKLRSLQKIDLNNAGTNKIKENVLNLWPDDKEISDFILNMENLAIAENVTFTNLSISEPKSSSKKKDSKKEAPSIEFSVESVGTYEQNQNIIKKLENFSRFSSIQSLSFSIKDNDIVSTKMTGRIFYGE